MDLQDYIQSLYDNSYETGELPNITKLNQNLLDILSRIYDDEVVLQKQFIYLKQRILDSCGLIIDNIDQINDKLNDNESVDYKYWAFSLLLSDGVSKALLSPVLTQKQEVNHSVSVNNFNDAVNEGFTHKVWNWTGDGLTTRHESNDGQVVLIDEFFEITNDDTGEVAYLQYPGDTVNDVSGSNSVICYCNVTYTNSSIAKHRINSISESNINGTVLMDNKPVYNESHAWNLSSGALKETFNLLKDRLPINVELTHLLQLDVDKPIMDKLGLNNVVTINDVDLNNERIVVTDSVINNAEIVPLVADKLVNGISVNYIDYNSFDVDNDITGGVKTKPINILSASLINMPSCPACTIKMAKAKDKDKMDKEDIKLITDIIAESFKGLKDELISINKPVEEEELVEDNVKTRTEIKLELEKELAEKALEADAHNLVEQFVSEGRILPDQFEANVAMAKANLNAYKDLMKPVGVNPVFNKIVGNTVEENDGFKVLNAKFRSGEL